MTLNLTPEEKAERRKQYKKEYSKNYYREQKAENTELYTAILDKAKERYRQKKEGGNVRVYKKRNILDKAENIFIKAENDNIKTN